MKRDEVRLECIKLAYAHGREPAQIVERAKILEDYVLEPLEYDSLMPLPMDKKSKAGNSQKPL